LYVRNPEGKKKKVARLKKRGPDRERIADGKPNPQLIPKNKGPLLRERFY